MRIALGIEYDGVPFNGWQVQPGCPTVQGVLEEALARFIGTDAPVPTICAGRTDTGVHASGQVVHVETGFRRSAYSWLRGTNSFLPPSVAVRWVKEVPEDFSARFSATGLTYEYWIANDPVRVPLLEGRAGWCFRPLSEDRMRQAASYLIGEHDFTSFRASECQAKSPVRTIESIDIVRRGRMIGIRFRANAFLHHMVRNIVGSLVYAGTGRETPEWVGEVLEAKNRSLAAPTYASAGLYLTGVRYPEELGLPAGAPSFFSADGVFDRF